MVAVTGQSPSPHGQSVLEAVLERITYANEDTGYTIARVATERTGPDLLTVVGPLLGRPGRGEPAADRTLGQPPQVRQAVHSGFLHHRAACHQPGHPRYLGSGMIQGIGPVMAERMVAHFGTGSWPSSNRSRAG